MLDGHYHWIGPDPRAVPMREAQRCHALLRIRLAHAVLRALAAEDERRARSTAWTTSRGAPEHERSRAASWAHERATATSAPPGGP